MNQRPKLLRRKIVVRAGQYSYGVAFALFAIAISTGLITASFMVFYSQATIPCPDGTQGCSAIIVEPDNAKSMILSLVLLTIPATIISFLLGIVLSHRTFGPLVRIKDFIDELKAGKYAARVKFRDKDHLGEVAGLLNELAQTLETKYGSQETPKDQQN